MYRLAPRALVPVSFLLVLASTGPRGEGQRSGQSFGQQSCLPLQDQVLRCPKFGFTYKIPFSWVDRTQQMQGSQQASSSGDTSSQSKAPAASSSRSETLLAAFQRPPEASDEGINSAIIIAAESVDNYPNLKTAADYFGPLSEIAEERGFKMDDAPYEFAVGAKHLVRGDFILGSDKTAVWQASLVTLTRRYIVSFTFVSGSESEIEDLIAGLSFGMPTSTPPGSHK